MPQCTCVGHKTACKVVLSFLPCRFWGWDSGHQSWQQVPLPPEPSHWSRKKIKNVYFVCRNVKLWPQNDLVFVPYLNRWGLGKFSNPFLLLKNPLFLSTNFQIESHSVDLGGLELRLIELTYFCLPVAGTKGVCHHALSNSLLFLTSNLKVERIKMYSKSLHGNQDLFPF